MSATGWDPFEPGPGPFGWQTSTAYHLLGDHVKELKAARLARLGAPHDMFALQNEVVALAALGRVPEIEKRIEERLEHRPDAPYPADPYGALIVRAGLELRAHGYAGAAEPFFERVVEWSHAHPLEGEHSESVALEGHWRGTALVLTGRWDEAEALFEWILVRSPQDVRARGALGALAARRGDRNAANEADRWLAGQRTESPVDGTINYERAAIAAVLGERERALTLLRQAIVEGFAFVSADYYLEFDVDPDLDSLRGDPAFQRLIEPKG
jgi:tetratricopeptide (TPR) repeat protein